MDDRVACVRQLLGEIHHVAVATVNANGSPHNTPVFVAFDDQLRAFWSSHPKSLHSVNVATTDKVFLALFDSRLGNGGLYIEGRARLVEHGSEFDHALETFNNTRNKLGKLVSDRAHFQGQKPQRLYQMDPQRIWINTSVRDDEGFVTRDTRHEISIKRLWPGNT